VRLEGLDQLKNAMSPLGIEPATFRLVALEPQPTNVDKKVLLNRKKTVLTVFVSIVGYVDLYRLFYCGQ
jgi:hypothetical protein